MALEEADKKNYQSRLESGIKLAEEGLEGQIGKEGINMEDKIKSAKDSIDSMRFKVVSDIESKTEGEGVDAAIEAGKFIKVLNDRAKEAIAEIDKNSDAYERRHQAHIDFATFRASMLNEDVNGQIWEVVNQFEGARGEKKIDEFEVNAETFSEIQQLEESLRNLASFSDKAREVRFVILEPGAEELERIKKNIGDTEPLMTAKIDEMLTSINEKISICKEAEKSYDKKLNEVKTRMPELIKKAETHAKELLDEFVETKKAADKKEGEVTLKDAYMANQAYMAQLRFVRQLKGYTGFVEKKNPTGYGGEEKAEEANV